MNRTVIHTGPASSLFQILVTRLGEQELRRRLWHFFPGMIALALASAPHRETVRLWVMLTIVICGIIAPALAAIRYQRAYRRRVEENPAPSILGYVIPVSILCLIFRSHVEIPLAVTTIIAFGDGSATFAGLLARGARVPWNSDKSWAGMLAFMVFGSIATCAVYWMATNQPLEPTQMLLCVVPVVFCCSLLETVPLRVNDNITVGCVSSLLLIALHTLIIGW